MSPEALTAERAYQDLRGAVLLGRFAPGESLNVQAIAQEFSMSISPVRDALHRMVGERLLTARASGGFVAMPLSEETAADLYRWHGWLVRGAVRKNRPIIAGDDLLQSLDRSDPMDREAIVTITAELFYRVGEGSDNVEHLLAIRAAGDQLTSLRLRESLLRGRRGELRNLILLAIAGSATPLRTALAAYHRRRLRNLVLLVRDSGSVDQGR